MMMRDGTSAAVAAAAAYSDDIPTAFPTVAAVAVPAVAATATATAKKHLSPSQKVGPVANLSLKNTPRRLSMRERGDFFATSPELSPVPASLSSAPTSPLPRPPPPPASSPGSAAPPPALAPAPAPVPALMKEDSLSSVKLELKEPDPLSICFPSSGMNKAIILRTASNDVGDFGEVYVPTSTTNLKCLPMEMLTSPNVKNSIAKGILLNALSQGITVIKHGRQGKPKKKVLTCNKSVTELHWHPENWSGASLDEDDASRCIKINEIVSIRLGTDIDPASSAAALEAAAAEGIINANALLKVVKEKEKHLHDDNCAPGIFGHILAKKELGILYGTSILRRNCKQDDMKNSFSLILPDRTFDVQCLTKKDCDLLTINLKELLRLGGFNSLADLENPLRSINSESEKISEPLGRPKKSVRFSSENLYSEALHREDSNLSCQETDMSHETDETNLSRQSSASEVFYLQEGDNNLDDIISSSHRGTNEQTQPPAAAADSFGPGQETQPSQMETASALRMTSAEALQIGMILAEQERRFSTNMYISLQPADEPKIEKYVARGFTTEEAIMRIFEKKYMSKEELRALGRSISADISYDEHNAVDEAGFRVLTIAPSFDDRDHFEDEKEDDNQFPLGPRSQDVAGRKSVFMAQMFENHGLVRQGGSDDEHDVRPVETYQRVGRVSSTDALQIGLLLSQQEQQFGTNMFESLSPEDEIQLQALRNSGYTMDQAALEIFTRKHPSDGSSHMNMRQQEQTNRTRRGSSFFPDSTSVLPNNTKMNPMPAAGNKTNMKEVTLRRMSSDDALRLALMLSEQEAQYGVNMYDSLQTADEPNIQNMMMGGYTMEQAVLEVFNTKIARKALRQTATSLLTTDETINQNYTPSFREAPGSNWNGDAYANQVRPRNVHNNEASYQTLPQPGANYHPQQNPNDPYGMQYPPAGGYGYNNYGYPPPNPYGYYPQNFGYHQQQQQQQYGYYPPPYPYAQPNYYPPYGGMPGGMPPGGMPQHPGYGGMNYPQQLSYQSPPLPYQHNQQQQQQGGTVPPPMQRNDSENTSFYGELVADESFNMNSTPNSGASVASGSTTRVRQTSNAVSTATSPPSIGAGPVGASPPPNPLNRQASTLNQDNSGGGKLKKLASKISLFGFNKNPQPADAFTGLGKMKYKESDVKTIMNMGFTRDQAVWALLQNENNVVMAINSLTS